jgi:hypothetical protein
MTTSGKNNDAGGISPDATGLPAFVTDEAFLRTPCCQDFYLHQGAVHVLVRRGAREDGSARVASISQNGDVEHTLLPPDNVPGRRQMVEIEFECEMCNANPRLRIQQHKGHTKVYWVKG